ncbi:hypothetical protein HY483_02335 [Candidatus Woesearchaeota archaeon]|nr:hypothetical protein [Candidatus Woesearchaeota archaeon]
MVKAQISLFIIIALAISAIVGGVVYTVQSQKVSITEAEILQVSRAPVEARPVEDFVRACMDEALLRGVISVGDRGGYSPSDSFSVNPSDPTDSEAIPLAEGVIDGSIPYWRFMSSKNKDCPSSSCVLSSKMPYLLKSDGSPSVEGAVEKVSKQFLLDCIADFSQLKNSGFTVVPKSSPSFSATINDRGVVGVLKYPIIVTRDDKSYNIETFYSNVEVPIKDLYELSSAITKEAGDSNFLEYSVINYLDMFTGLDDDSLPPISDLDLSLSPKSWNVLDVKEKVSSSIIPQAILFLQVFPSKNYKALESPFPLSEEREAVFSMLYNRDFRTSLINKTSKPIIVNVNFEPVTDFSLTPYFKMNCEGVCSAESLNILGVLPLGIQKYNFAYDISYPVIVRLEDPDALNGLGYSFQFGLEGNIRSNEPVKGSSSIVQNSDFSSTISLFSQKEHWTSGDVKIVISDLVNHDNNAAVVFECGTKAASLGIVNNSITTKLPRCTDGHLRAVKQDYSSSNPRISTFTSDPQIVGIDISPIVPVFFTVKKVPLTKNSDNNWNLLSDRRESLDNGESVLVVLDKIGGGDSITAVSQLFGGSAKTSSTKNSSISAGDYSVSMFLTRKSPKGEEVIIMPQERCYGPGDLGDVITGDEECAMVPAKPEVFNETKPLLLGQSEFNMTITSGMISAKGVNINLLVPYADLKSACDSGICVIEDLSVPSTAGDYVSLYPDVFNPVVVPKR